MEIFALFSVKNAGFVFFIGATVDLPGEVFSSLGNLLSHLIVEFFSFLPIIFDKICIFSFLYFILIE